MPEVIQQVQKRMLISLSQIVKKLNIQEGDYIVLEEQDGGILNRGQGLPAFELTKKLAAKDITSVLEIQWLWDLI